MVTQIYKWGKTASMPHGAVIYFKDDHVDGASQSGDGYSVGLVMGCGLPKRILADVTNRFLEAVIAVHKSPVMDEIRAASQGYGWCDEPPSYARIKKHKGIVRGWPVFKQIICVDARVPEIRAQAEKFAKALEERLKE